MADLEAVLTKDGASPESTAAQAEPVEAGRTADQPEPGAPEPEKESGEEEHEHKREGGYKRKLRREREEKEYWRAKALEVQKPAPEPAPTDDPEPKYEDYEDKPIADYNRAWAEWTRRQAVKDATAAYESQSKAKAQQSEFERVQREFLKREAAFSAAHEDYEDAAEAASKLLSEKQTPTSGSVQHALILDDSGPALLYHLGQHPEEIERLLELPPPLALKELGKLEARIAKDTAAEPEKPEPRITQAPPPPTPLRKVTRADDGGLRDDLPPEEWGRRFRKRMEKS